MAMQSELHAFHRLCLEFQESEIGPQIGFLFQPFHLSYGGIEYISKPNALLLSSCSSTRIDSSWFDLNYEKHENQHPFDSHPLHKSLIRIKLEDVVAPNQYFVRMGEFPQLIGAQAISVYDTLDKTYNIQNKIISFIKI